MSCWTKNITEEMTAAKIKVNWSNRKKIDKHFRQKLGLGTEIECPQVWKEYIKPLLNDVEKKSEFIIEIENLFAK